MKELFQSRSDCAVWAPLLLLIVLRLPAPVQPTGPDQGIYAYIGQRILEGELPSP